MNFKKYIPLLSLIVVTIVLFLPALNGGYLNWDDNQQITDNQDVLHFSWQSIQNYFSTFYVGSYQPIASLSFGLEYYFFGNNPFVPHFTNLLLHILNIIVVYFLLDKINPKQKILNYFVLSVFAFHPLQTELLGWISTRSTLLSSLFFLLAVLMYISYVIEKDKKKKYFWGTLLFFVLSLFSKTSAIVLPFVLLSLDYLYRRKFTLKVVLEKIPFFAGSFVIGVVSIVSRGVVLTNEYNQYYSLYEKISISCYSAFLYLKKSFIPEDLFFFYGYPYRIEDEKYISFTFLLAPLWILLIAAFCWVVYKKLSNENKRLWVFGILFFLINIMIIVNVTSFSDTFFSERYMYIAILGVFIAVSVLLQEFIFNTKIVKNGAYIVLGVFLISLGIKSSERSGLWKSDMSLWTFVEKTKSQNSTPYRMLGKLYAAKENHEKAVEIYNNGIKIYPNNINLYYWRALSIKELGDVNYAQKDLNRVINSKDKLIGDAFYQKALIFRSLKMLDSARIYIDSAKAHNNQLAIFDNNNLGLTSGNQLQNAERIILKRIDSLLELKKFDEVKTGYENLLLLSPSNIFYMIEKGKLESSLEKWEEAILTFSKIISIDPEHKMARLNRAYAYSIKNNISESITDYTYVIDHTDKEDGEIYYFRALVFLKNKQIDLACKDIINAKKFGYKNIAEEINQKICK